MFRIYVERKPGFQSEAQSILSEINGFLGISSVKGVRYFNRYDIENTSEEVSKMAALRIFSEPQSDSVAYEEVKIDEKTRLLSGNICLDSMTSVLILLSSVFLFCVNL